MFHQKHNTKKGEVVKEKGGLMLEEFMDKIYFLPFKLMDEVKSKVWRAVIFIPGMIVAIAWGILLLPAFVIIALLEVLEDFIGE